MNKATSFVFDKSIDYTKVKSKYLTMFYCATPNITGYAWKSLDLTTNDVWK